MEKTDPEFEDLRQLYRRKLQHPGTEACPDDERLAALTLGEVDGDERVRLAEHVVRCSACSENVRLLMELNGEAGRQKRSLWNSNLVRVLAAAGVLVALGVLLRGTPTSDDVERGAVIVTTPEDRAELASAPRELTWQAQPGATSYRVRLFDSSADLLWESELADRPAIELPASVAEDLEPGASYFWTVELEGLGPAEAARIGPFWFRISDAR